MKSYKFLRGLLKASALTSVMFVMQACYGSPNPNKHEELNRPDATISTLNRVKDGINSANSCEELEIVMHDFEYDYDVIERFLNDTTKTKEEKEMLEMQLEEISTLFSSKAETLRCE